MNRTLHCKQHTNIVHTTNHEPALPPPTIGKHVDKLALQTNYLLKVFGQSEINWTAAKQCIQCVCVCVFEPQPDGRGKGLRMPKVWMALRGTLNNNTPEVEMLESKVYITIISE